jgi:hypothetical protein
LFDERQALLEMDHGFATAQPLRGQFFRLAPPGDGRSQLAGFAW